ncbi:MAG: hypothetical protein M1457_03790, partial [bacterium]|nr:hypothetical protein [bacterium]
MAPLLTAGTYQARLLQQTRILSLKNTLTVVATGNNTRCSGEIAKRVVPITLQPKDAHPERRTKFVHPDIFAHVREWRYYILSILTGMIDSWIVGGCPPSPKPRPMGGFEDWARMIGGIMWYNGFQHWRLNEEAWQAKRDDDGEQRDQFVTAWWNEVQ